jgi:hypothetical protein
VEQGGEVHQPLEFRILFARAGRKVSC